MSEIALVRLAAWREIYARRKAFLISTGITLTVVVSAIVAAGLLTGAAEPLTRVGVVGALPPDAAPRIEQMLPDGTAFEVVSFPTRADGEVALAGGGVNALVIGPLDVRWGPTTDGATVEAVSEALRQSHLATMAEELGLSVADLGRLLTPVRGESLDFEEEDVGAEVMSVVTVILIFIAIIAYGQWIAYGVVEEKANRVAELILGALRPAQLLVAKIVSIGALGLVQLTLVVAAAVATASAFDTIELPPVAGAAMVWVPVWFLLGYGFYGTLYAAAGSLAADTQEAGNAIGPLNLIPAIGYMFGVGSMGAGSDTLLVQVLSLLPPWTPLLMPARWSRGWAEPWEVALAIGLIVLSIVLMVRLAGRIYRGGMVQASQSVGWRQAFRSGGDLVGTRS